MPTPNPAFPRHARPEGLPARFRPRLLTLAVLSACASLALAAQNIHTALPPGTVPTGGTVATPGTATIVTAPNLVQINQTAAQTTINWSTFNIAQGSQVRFNQPSPSSEALNLIGDSSPSVIQGTLTANGKVYLVNHNGILFDGSAQVNVNSLIASSLDLPTFNQGITSSLVGAPAPVPVATLALDATTGKLLAGQVINYGSIRSVQVDGPSGQVQNDATSGQPLAPGGTIMLFAPQVENHGVITANNGQVILAAGGTVYLQIYNDPTGTNYNPNDLSMRGFLVKVTAAPSGSLNVSDLIAAQNLNSAANIGGTIQSDRGNTTLTGLMVNQSGLISANTAATVNGSIWLVAANYDTSTTTPTTTYGTLTTGKGSVTQTLPVNDGTTLAQDTQYSDNSLYNSGSFPHYQAVIKLLGENIDLEGAALAPGGRIAVGKEYIDNSALPAETGRVYLGANSVLSAAGDWVDLPYADNYLTFKLGSLDLANDPLQKGGFLINQTVTVDTRQASPLLFDISGKVNNIQDTVLQMATAGGAISVNTGHFITAAGSSVDVSGGGYRYASGNRTTTYLVSNGHQYNLATAPINLQYTGILTQTAAMPGFVQGMSAGLLAIDAPQIALAGNLAGGVTIGPYQRAPGSLPTPGTLVLGTQSTQGSSSLDYSTVQEGSVANSLDNSSAVYALKDVQFGPGAQTRQQISDALSGVNADPLNAAYPASLTDKVLLPLDLFGNTSSSNAQATVSQGFGSLTLRASGDITVPQGQTLNLGVNGSLLWFGQNIDVEGAVLAQGGALNFNQLYDHALVGTTVLGAQGLLSTAGGWINDAYGATLPVSAANAINGGTIAIGSYATLDPGSMIDASGGALLSAAGKPTYGNGGGISLPTDALTGVTLQAYGGKGGALTLAADTIDVGGSAADALAPAFFTQGGFTQYTLDGFTQVDFASSLHPIARQRILNANARLFPTGTTYAAVSSLWSAQPDYLRTPASITANTAASTSTTYQLNAIETGITVAPGVSISTDPLGSITLASKTRMDIAGTLTAPGGKISLSLDPGKGFYYDTATGSFNALDIGSQAQISTAGVFLPGTGLPGLISGEVLRGGSISIATNKNDLDIAQGAVLDVSGSTHLVDLALGSGGTSRSNVASEGGSISIQASENAYLDGTFKGQGGNAAVAGGSFTLNLPYNGASSETTLYASLFANTLNNLLATAALTFMDPQQQQLGHTIVVSQAPTPLPQSGSSSSSEIGNLIDAKGDFTASLRADISADQLVNGVPQNGVRVGGGFDLVTLSSDNTILFAAGVSNFAPRALLRLDAPELAVQGGVGVGVGNGSSWQTAQLQLYNTPDSFRLSSNLPFSITQNYPLLTTVDGNGNPIPIPALNAQVPVQTHAGSGSLTLSAGQIGLAGNITVNGVSSLSLKSSGDLVFEGFPVSYTTPTSDTDPLPLIATLQGLSGRLSSAGNITLQASQIYPASEVNYTVAVENVGITNLTQNPTSLQLSLDISRSPVSGGLLSVLGNGNAQAPVLSAGGVLTLNADHIDQAGTIRAPLGDIELQGTSSVTLENGSLTSVSALWDDNGVEIALVIPYGASQSVGQSLWYGNLQTMAPPAKQIDINATTVTLATGATVDIRGGGDIAAMEFVPGIGGTKDVLAAAGTYAIVPGVAFPTADGQLAGMDPINVKGATAYNTVTLAAGSGLPAGNYALLPAYYALLPGAYLVKAQSGAAFSNMTPGQATIQNDGSVVVAGKLGFAGTEIAQSTWSGFSIQSGADALTNSSHAQGQYLVSGSSFFATQAANDATAAPALPQDGGHLSLGATGGLSFQGNLLAHAAQGGAIGQVDIYGSRFAIVANNAVAPTGYTSLQAVDLSNMDASVMIGGQRTDTADGESVHVVASDVSVDLNGGTVTLPELYLVASNSLNVSADSSLTASGSVVGRGGTLTINPINGSQYGALLGLSSGQLAVIARPGNVGPSSGGNLNIATGAHLNAVGGSIAVDSTGTPLMGGVMNSTTLEIGAGQIALGAVPAGGTALALNSAQLAALSSARNFLLHSYSSIDLYGAVSLGQAGVGSFTLDSAGLIGHDANGLSAPVQLSASQITLENLSGASLTTSAPGTGTLNLTADKLVLGNSGTAGFGLAGFSTVDVQAGEVSLQGTGVLNVGAALNIQSARIDAGSAQANQQILAQDTQQVWHPVTITRQAGASSTTAMPGGQLLIAGSTVDFGGNLFMQSGRVTLAAHGAASTDGVTLENGASIDLSSYEKTFAQGSANLTESADAGRLTLSSDNGSVAALSGSNIDLKGGAAGGNAGMLTATAAKGTVSLGGSLAATAAAGTSGSASLYAGNLGNFTALNTVLEGGGFDQSRTLRAGSGNIDVTGTLTAQNVQLVADAGNITVEGVINASGDAGGGSVELDAGLGITLSGQILAKGTSNDITGPNSNGGTVGLYARGGALDFASGALIDVSAVGKSSGGEIVFSAPRSATSVNATLAGQVNVAGGTVSVPGGQAPSNGDVILEGYKRYTGITTTSSASATTSVEYTDFNTFMNAEKGLQDPAWAALLAANPALTGNQLAVRAALELDSGSNLTVNSAWDLTNAANWLPSGANEAAGRLVLRAAGNLAVNAKLGLPNDVSLPPASGWSLQLAGGADLASADVQAVKASTTSGDVALASGIKITTSTGDIQIAAGRDFIAASPSSVIYTTGSAVTLPSFMATTPMSYAAPSSGVNFIDGGSISITADRNVTGNGTYASIDSWLRRTTSTPGATLNGVVTSPAGFSYLPAYWWVDRAGNTTAKTTGVQGIATLGGGDITIAAGYTISDLSVASTSSRSAATTATATLVNNRNAIPSQNEVYGGGNIHIDVGGSLLGGQYLVSLGTATLTAGGSIGGLTAATATTTAPAFWLMGYSDDPARQGANIQVQALGSVTLGTVANPTVEALVGNAGTNKTVTTPGYRGLGSNFFSYSPEDSIAATAVGGDLQIVGAQPGTAVQKANDVLPPIFSAVALEGSVSSSPDHYFSASSAGVAVTGSAASANLYQYPDSNGGFLLLAEKSVHDLALMESDTLPASLTTAGDLVLNTSDYTAVGSSSAYYIFNSPISTAAKMVTPATLHGYRYAVVADTGSVSNAAFYFPQQSVVAAGMDIANVQLDLQNLGTGGLSQITAGRDLSFTNVLSNGTQWGTMPHIQIAGPGSLLVDAGRDINLSAVTTLPLQSNSASDLNNVARIDAIGNTDNASLPSADAAALTLMAGVYPASLSTAQADGLFSVLLSVGQAAGDPKAYNSALAAANTLIASLFDDGQVHQGDITLYNARISSGTNSGGTAGDISLLTPYANIDVGLPTASSGRNIGIYTSDGAGINAYLSGDLNVNLSKVATFQGGDILLYTSGNGSSLDAGRGSRSATTTSPPREVPVKDASGKVTGFMLLPPLDVSGSGIRTVSYDPDGAGPLQAPTPGKVYLLAPTGTIDAGEAGVSSASGLVVLAAIVKNADNFAAGGSSVGVPSVSSVAPPSAPVTGDTGANATKAANDMTQASGALAESSAQQDSDMNSFRPTFITVEVLGFGNDSDNTEGDDEKKKRKGG